MDEQDNAFPQDGWECTGCAEDYTIAADGQPFEIGAGEYCLNCIEDHFRPIANFGDEENGIPRIEDDVLEERRDILVAMDPDLLARYRRQMVSDDSPRHTTVVHGNELSPGSKRATWNTDLATRFRSGPVLHCIVSSARISSTEPSATSSFAKGRK